MSALIVLLAFLASAPQASPKTALGQAVSGAYRIGGVVVDANSGAPVAEAEVSISGGKTRISTTADDYGRFSFDGLSEGKYRLFARAQGYVPASYDQHGPFSTAIVAGEGADTEHILFPLARQGVIYGTVTDERGNPVRRAQVMLFGEASAGGVHQGVSQGWDQTNDLGQYRFAHLAPGKYHVGVQARPWYAQTGFKYPVEETPRSGSGPGIWAGSGMGRPAVNPLLDVVYPLTFYPNATEADQAGEVELTAGEEYEADIQLTAVPSVHVLVSGLPRQGANGGGMYPTIGVTERAFGTWIPVTTGAQQREVAPGEWEEAGLPPGPIRLTVRVGDDKAWGERHIAVNMGNGDTIDASSAPGPVDVSGRVNLPAEITTAEKVHVVLTSRTEERAVNVQVQKDGTFSQSIEPGSYDVRVWVDGGRGVEYLQSIMAKGARVNGRAVTIPAGGDVQLALTIGSGVGVVKGVAKLAGKPEGGVLVLLVPAEAQSAGDESRRDQSDSDGSFTLPNVLPGKYLLLAVADGWKLDWSDPAVVKQYRERGQAIQVEAGQTQTVNTNVQELVAESARN